MRPAETTGATTSPVWSSSSFTRLSGGICPGDDDVDGSRLSGGVVSVMAGGSVDAVNAVVAEEAEALVSTGWKAKCFHALVLYRLVFSSRFLRLCSDMTWDRMRLRVSSRVPSETDCGSVWTQNSDDLPPPALLPLRGLRILDTAPPLLASARWDSGGGCERLAWTGGVTKDGGGGA